MTTCHTPTRIRIETPDASSAFVLERRLAPFHAFVLGLGPRWGVELDDYEEQREEITASVSHWLRDRGLHSAPMYVDNVLTTVAVHPNGDSLGGDYESGRVLEHEP